MFGELPRDSAQDQSREITPAMEATHRFPNRQTASDARRLMPSNTESSAHRQTTQLVH